MAISGLILIFVGSLSLPFLKHPPGRDDNGYFLISPRTEEKIYSDDAREAYFAYAIGTTTATVGLGLIVFIPIVIIFDLSLIHI